MNRTAFFGLTAALALGAAAALGGADAQPSASYPEKPIHLVVGYPPGGFPDTMARLFGDQLGKRLNQPVIVDNKPSAGAVIAAETVARSATDGYSLLVSDVQVWAIDALIYKTLPFDPFRDFTPITILASAPNFFVMSSLLPVSNEFDRLIAFLKQHPHTYNYGTAGIGSIHHFTMELLKSKTGISVTHVPYKGGNQVLPALASGEVALGIQSLSQLPTFLRQGTVKTVAVATAKRSPALPDVPTLAELGVADMDLPGSMGLLAPKGTPPDIVAKIAAAIKEAAQDSALQSKLSSLGVVPVANTPQEMADWMKSDAARYAKAAELAGIKPD